jgi:hypothetical protein
MLHAPEWTRMLTTLRMGSQTSCPFFVARVALFALPAWRLHFVQKIRKPAQDGTADSAPKTETKPPRSFGSEPLGPRHRTEPWKLRGFAPKGVRSPRSQPTWLAAAGLSSDTSGSRPPDRYDE